jgi:CRISPR-associated exonuclease Cas4
MLSVSVPAGAIFYGRTRRRLDVSFDDSLRKETEDAAKKAHDLIASGITPPPVYEKRCESCSLMEQCLPRTIQKRRPVKTYLTKMLSEP